MTIDDMKAILESIKKLENQVSIQSAYIIYPTRSSIAVALTVEEWNKLIGFINYFDMKKTKK